MRFKILSIIAVAGLLSACAAPGGGAGGAGGAGSADSGYAPGSQEDLAVNVGDRVHFDFDKYSLSPESRYTLQQQAAWLAANEGVSITVEGHADERGTREYNLALGERRAQAAADYLMVLGVSKDRVQTVSYGKERPEDPGSNEAAWAKNRRAVSVVK
ncbi:MAG: peptidoglycan-associated lipoprotein Pal [Rhodospirillaceae bacterium]|nr:peptidoglycan-associated lipoprotein Pal [Rhodospirillaceae bacterium]